MTLSEQLSIYDEIKHLWDDFFPISLTRPYAHLFYKQTKEFSVNLFSLQKKNLNHSLLKNRVQHKPKTVHLKPNPVQKSPVLWIEKLISFQTTFLSRNSQNPDLKHANFQSQNRVSSTRKIQIFIRSKPWVSRGKTRENFTQNCQRKPCIKRARGDIFFKEISGGKIRPSQESKNKGGSRAFQN